MSASFLTIIETVAYTMFTLTKKIISVMMSRTLKYSSYYHTFKEIVLEEQFANPIINPKQTSPSYGFLSEW